MSTYPIEPIALPGDHLERAVEDQLARAKPWMPVEQPVLDDLTDEEEAAFLEAISR
jgi:hypothetical protein